MTCEGEDYYYFRGNCYRYYQWVLRHYLPLNYTFQETWQVALDKCKSENATLVSIHDEEEAYFIQVQRNVRRVTFRGHRFQIYLQWNLTP